MEQRDLLTDKARTEWRAWLETEFPPEQVGNVRYQARYASGQSG